MKMSGLDQAQLEPSPLLSQGGEEGSCQAKSWSWDVCRGAPATIEERVRRLSSTGLTIPGRERG